MRAYLFLSVAFLLAACSPPATTVDQSGSTTPSASNATPSAAVPQMRLGRWNKVITVMGQQSTQVECVTNADLNQMAAEPNAHCTSAQGFHRTAEGLVYEAQCTGEDGGGSMRTVMNGDMQNHYTADMTMTGAGMGEGMRVRIEGTYEGACRGDE